VTRPLQCWLFIPELQWQSRGKWRILQRCKQVTRLQAAWRGHTTRHDFRCPHCNRPWAPRQVKLKIKSLDSGADTEKKRRLGKKMDW
jgi:hypothetical protein